jgi:hypothetical protein
MNFLNSPPGPLGQAGQSSTSTQPPSLTSGNGSPQFNRFGQGAQSFADRIGGAGGKAQDVLSRLFGNLFGGQGDLAQGFPGQGEPVQGGFPGQLPGQGAPQGGPLASVLGGGKPSITGQGQGGGFLSRFMQGQNGQV